MWIDVQDHDERDAPVAVDLVIDPDGAIVRAVTLPAGAKVRYPTAGEVERAYADGHGVDPEIDVNG